MPPKAKRSLNLMTFRRLKSGRELDLHEDAAAADRVMRRRRDG
jgi:hypothetical protein